MNSLSKAIAMMLREAGLQATASGVFYASGDEIGKSPNGFQPHRPLQQQQAQGRAAVRPDQERTSSGAAGEAEEATKRSSRTAAKPMPGDFPVMEKSDGDQRRQRHGNSTATRATPMEATRDAPDVGQDGDRAPANGTGAGSRCCDLRGRRTSSPQAWCWWSRRRRTLDHRSLYSPVLLKRAAIDYTSSPFQIVFYRRWAFTLHRATEQTGCAEIAMYVDTSMIDGHSRPLEEGQAVIDSVIEECRPAAVTVYCIGNRLGTWTA